MGTDPLSLADLLKENLPGHREDRLEEAGAIPRPGAAAVGDDLRDVSAELSALLRDLARTPETAVDVASGWTPGLSPGDVVGRFELLRELGRGGFGVVYEALDHDLGRTVAFKAVRPGRRIAGRSEEWLRAEAEAVARLNHPNIVTLHDFGRGPSGPYLIFELLKGETLSDRLHAGALPLREAIAVAVDVARVLAHAHRAGVVHRDLKPANVFLGEDGAVKVLDFGLAYLFGRGGPVSGGTPAYMAPEQWRSSPGDERTDLFALGTLVHQMISGSVPYRVVKDRSEALDPGPPPLLPRAAAPAALRRLVAGMLEKDPAARPSSAQAVLGELLAVQRRLAGRPGVRRALFASALAALVLAAGFALKAARDELPGAGEKLVVAVADFENGTGDRELDGLSGLLVTSLEQSRRFQVLTRSRLLALLRRAGKGDTARIDDGVAEELARAAGARVLLVGSAKRSDSTYALEIEAVDPSVQGHRHLFSLREVAPARADVLPAIDRLSAAARRELREQADEIRGSRIQVAEALTSNVEAYQAYFEGVDCVERPSRAASWNTYDTACAAHFRRALAFDPTFALAHYRLAYLLGSVTNQSDSSVDAHMSAALRYVDRAPPKEAALVRAWKAHLDGREEEALALYGAMLGRFPDDRDALWNSGEIQVQRGEVGAAVPFFEKLLSIEPSSEWPLNSLVNALGALRRRQELEALASRLAGERHGATALHGIVRARFWLGDAEGALAAAREAVQRGFGRAADTDLLRVLHAVGAWSELEPELRRRLEDDPHDLSDWYLLANALASQGRRSEGLRLLDRLSERSDAATQGSVQLARAMYVAGGADAAQRWREAARARALAPQHSGFLALPLALLGDLGHAAELAPLLAGRATAREEYEALVQWRKGDAMGAAGRLAALDAHDPWPELGLAPSYLLAEVSADMKDWRGALASIGRFRSLWPRGLWWSWAMPRASYLAALAHAELGEPEAAGQELDRLLAWWQKADPGLPLALEARELQRRLGR